MASGNNIKAHSETYSGFLGIFKWSAIAVILITAFVIFLIA